MFEDDMGFRNLGYFASFSPTFDVGFLAVGKIGIPEVAEHIFCSIEYVFVILCFTADFDGH